MCMHASSKCGTFFAGGAAPQFASAGADRKVKLWDLRLRECMHAFDGHTDQVWVRMKLSILSVHMVFIESAVIKPHTSIRTLPTIPTEQESHQWATTFRSSLAAQGKTVVGKNQV